MADTVTVHRNFKPGEILVEVVSVGLYGLTAAEVPIAPIAGLEASTVQGALEGINENTSITSGTWKAKVRGSTSGTSEPIYTFNSCDFIKIGSIVINRISIGISKLNEISGNLVIDAFPFITKGGINSNSAFFYNLAVGSRILNSTCVINLRGNTNYGDLLFQGVVGEDIYIHAADLGESFRISACIIQTTT